MLIPPRAGAVSPAFPEGAGAADWACGLAADGSEAGGGATLASAEGAVAAAVAPEGLPGLAGGFPEVPDGCAGTAEAAAAFSFSLSVSRSPGADFFVVLVDRVAFTAERERAVLDDVARRSVTVIVSVVGLVALGSVGDAEEEEVVVDDVDGGWAEGVATGAGLAAAGFVSGTGTVATGKGAGD